MEISSSLKNDDSDQCTQSAFVGAAVASSLTKLTPDDVNTFSEQASSKSERGSTNVNTYLAVEAMATTPPSINTSSILKNNSNAFTKNSNFLFYFSNQYQSTKNNKENNEDAISVDSISSSSASSSCLSFSNFNSNANRPKPHYHQNHHYHSTSNQQYVSVTSHGVSSTNSTITTTINPFEETNRHRLEQSVLSPNLFHVASTSTPERDTNCLWNIDQRAVLYPADIPTDESSLVAQYVHDQKLNRQLSAAVETFWSQNQIIIESPLAGAASGSQFGGSNSSGSGYGPLRNRLNAAGSSNNSSAKSNNFKSSFNVNSPLAASNNATPLSNKARQNPTNNGTNTNSNNRNNHLNRFKQQHHHQHQLQQQQSNIQKGQYQAKQQSNKDDQANQQSLSPPSLTKQSKMLKQSCYESKYCQTVLSFPSNFDLNQIPELKQFLSYDDDACDNSPKSPKDINMKEVTLNNSIRKKLFDHHSSEDHPTLTTMATSYAAVVVDTHRLVDDAKGQLPKPEFLPSSSTWSDIEMAASSKMKSTKESSSSNWQEDSLEFQDDDHQFASSPKSYRKYSNIMHDIGDDEDALYFGTDAIEDLDDSVFYSQFQSQQQQQQEQQQQQQTGNQRKQLTPPNVSPLHSYQDKDSHRETHFKFK